MPDELNGTTGTKQATKQVVIPECLRGIVGNFSINSVAPVSDPHWCYSLGWHSDKGWSINYCEDTGKAAGQDCSFIERCYYLHSSDGILSWVEGNEEEVTYFTTRESAIEALQQIVSTLGWPALQMRNQSVEYSLWFDSTYSYHDFYKVEQVDSGRWIVNAQFESPFYYLLFRKDDGSLEWLNNDHTPDDDSAATRFDSWEDAVAALRAKCERYLVHTDLELSVTA